MKRPLWILPIILAYLLTVAAVFLSPILFLGWSANTYSEWPVIIIMALWPICLAALLFVPIQVVRRRPLTRRTIWVPLLTTGFLAAVLLVAAAFAIIELFKIRGPDWFLNGIFFSMPGTWACWTGLFYLLTRQKGPNAVGLAIHRWLFAGSVLELLIAVPAHVIVRRRTECCAGMYTGCAIACGILIALLAFGPSLALLFIHRWKRIANPIPPNAPSFEIQPANSPPAPLTSASSAATTASATPPPAPSATPPLSHSQSR